MFEPVIGKIGSSIVRERAENGAYMLIVVSFMNVSEALGRQLTGETEANSYVSLDLFVLSAST